MDLLEALPVYICVFLIISSYCFSLTGYDQVSYIWKSYIEFVLFTRL